MGGEPGGDGAGDPAGVGLYGRVSIDEDESVLFKSGFGGTVVLEICLVV